MDILYFTPGLLTPIFGHPAVIPPPQPGTFVTDPSGKQYKVSSLHYNFHRQGIEVHLQATVQTAPTAGIITT